MEGLDVNISNDIAIKEIKDFKRGAVKLADKFNSYIKLETKKKDIEKKDIEKKDIEKKDTAKEHIKKVNAEKNSVERDANNKAATTSVDIKAYIIDKQKLIKKRYKSLLETKNTITNNIELVYSALKKLPKESQPKLTELIRLDTISNDSINAVWREIYEREGERERKVFKKIDANKIKNVYGFINQLINIINNKTVLLKTTVVVKLSRIIK